MTPGLTATENPPIIGSYSGDPTTTPLDEVRFLIGDTNSSNWNLGDAEINYTISLVYGSLANAPVNQNYLPAAYCAEAIAARYKFLVDKSVGDLRISYTSLLKNFQALAGRLRSRAALVAVPFYVGGLSLAAKIAQNADPDLVSTAVKIDGMNYIDSIPNQNDSTGGCDYGGGGESGANATSPEGPEGNVGATGPEGPEGPAGSAGGGGISYP